MYSVVKFYTHACAFCSYRIKTSIPQKLSAQLEAKLEKFIDNIRVLYETHQFPDAHILNMDEMPIYFDMPGNTAVNEKSYREFRIKSTGAEKQCITVIQACTVAGDMLPQW